VDDDRFRRRAPAPDDGHGLIRRTDSRSLGFGLGLMASVADELAVATHNGKPATSVSLHAGRSGRQLCPVSSVTP
jgi:hypothetical protein